MEGTSRLMLTQRIIRGSYGAPVPPAATQEYSGALPIGTAAYAIPSSNVIYLATTGNNANNGLTPATAKASLQAAVDAVPENGTVVVRAGTYNQAYPGNMTKTVTIQNYPNETVWFDGTTQITNWTDNGDGTWYCATPAVFDHGADYSGTGDASRWIDGQTRDRAFWPEMVFINDIEQFHTDGAVTAGTFKVDYDTSRIYIGTNPSGKSIFVTNLGRLMVVKAPNCLLRGFGVRRYAASMVSNGAITPVMASAGTIQENLHFTEMPIQATSMSGDNSVIRNCTFTNIGMMAVSCNRGDSAQFTNNYLEKINQRLFKGPTPAGVKFARWTNGLVAHNYIKTANRVFGVWMDVYNYRCVMLNNYVEDSGGGVFYEISWNGYLVNNRTKNIKNGTSTSSYWVFDCRDTQLWLNEADRGTGYDIWLSSDSRQGQAGEPPIGGLGDLRTSNALVCNNIYSNYTSSNGVWRTLIENISSSEDCAYYVDRYAGNVISSTNASSSASNISRYLTIERSDGQVITATSNDDAVTNWGSSKIGQNFTTTTQVPSTGNVITPSLITAIAEPLPADIAALVGLPTGAKVIGPVLPTPLPRVPSY